MGEFGRILPQRRSGGEAFRNATEPLGFDLLSFWQWSSSDVVSNVTRGVLAEYLVAQAVGAADGVRKEWDAYDVLDPQGTAIEVKSAAYVQCWPQERASSIRFSCGETLGWNAETNEQTSEKRRQAQVYVFALLAHQDQETLDPLDLSQWHFFVLPTAVLNRHAGGQRSISLSILEALHGPPVGYHGLKEAITEAGAG